MVAIALTLAACSSQSGSGNRTDTASAQRQAQWNEDAIHDLKQAIDSRAAHGLDHLSFGVEGEPTTSAGQDALTQSALRYARALAGGASDPKKLYEVYTLGTFRPDLQRGLKDALASGKLRGWLDGLAPQEEDYRNLSRAYLALGKERSGAAKPIPDAGKPIDPGTSDSRMPAIERQLVASGYLDRAGNAGIRYAEPLVRAVKHMQVDYGIKPDGVIGEKALEILNLSDADRAREIAVAMERMRWLDRAPPGTRIDVNLAAARLTYWRDGKIADTRKAVVGEPDTETPQLGSPIYRLVANPTWTVPRSIQNKEIAGKGAGYMKRNNMVWKDGWIVQQPGPKNSLGLVKFDMKNDHEIYLHDTPAKQLFSEVQRQRSHGCIRVEDAVGFAEKIARDEGILDQWNKVRATGKEGFVELPREIPVRLLYSTILFDNKGAPVIRADPYGWNERVAKALGFGQRKGSRLRAGGDDVGP
ncbi:murein L,D-transpeptidase [Sphingobium yanoikuyae]|uniref:Murein L,D-transpeptidase n=2 Tax=Sphingobium yanoikuyae TaxID=13690 RepID=A0A2D1R5Z6_SPHYA|nr:murein L,D-transpeptidase [Sphingobium yanoikuyae]